MTKKLLRGVLILGWIPTLMFAGGVRWFSPENVAAQERTPIKVTRIYTGDDGKTHAEELAMPLGPTRGATELSPSIPVTSVQFRRTSQRTSSIGTPRRAGSMSSRWPEKARSKSVMARRSVFIPVTSYLPRIWRAKGISRERSGRATGSPFFFHLPRLRLEDAELDMDGPEVWGTASKEAARALSGTM